MTSIVIIPNFLMSDIQFFSYSLPPSRDMDHTMATIAVTSDQPLMHYTCGCNETVILFISIK